jgi:hypothetical protein
MSDVKCPDRASWDPFCQRVQEELVDHLGLENAVISVNRHHGMNTNIDVNLTEHSGDKPASHTDYHALVGDQIQLTMNQLTRQVKSIVDMLLEDCDVCFGEISFHVKRRILEKIEFSYSKRPHESTACFF